MSRARILVIDDEVIVRKSCARILAPEGYEVKSAENGHTAMEMLGRESFDLVLTDLKMPEMDGMEVLRKMRESWPHIDVIIMTGFGTVASAVRAMKAGAFDYVEKPFSPVELLPLVARALERKKLTMENAGAREEAASRYELDNIVGISQAMQKILHLVARVAGTGSTVLVTGESGTGKELVAKAVHFNSPRRDQPFIIVDCNTIPGGLIESELFGHARGAFTGAHEDKKGLVELAHGGTLFFDEIGNLDLPTQAKLLRVLQEKEFRPVGEKKSRKVDIRFISATNRDLHQMTKDGLFREDFFYRLNIFPIHIPPLRERREDIPYLSYHFLQKYNGELDKSVHHITAEAMKILTSFQWPGNVRQLENLIQRAMIMCHGRSLGQEHFAQLIVREGEKIPSSLSELKKRRKSLRNESVESIEKAFLLDALRRNGWNVSKAASEVNMQRTNFHALLRKHNISRKAAHSLDSV